MYKTIIEGKAKLKVAEEEKVCRKLPVFYNPVMKSNRDISVLLLKCIGLSDASVCLPLAGSGVRGIRFLLELDNVSGVVFNDMKESAVKIIKENLKLNSLKATVENKDANELLAEGSFDYIDIDPFGPPVRFLGPAIDSLSKRGVLAVTATDTSALAGTYINSCKRKYHSVPLKNGFMHETGLRILIRYMQKVGLDNGKSLVPVFSYFKDHYMRVFFVEGKEDVLSKHKYLHFCPNCLHRSISSKDSGKCICGEKALVAGPLWTGKLWDSELVDKMAAKNTFIDLNNFFETIRGEYKLDVVGFYHIGKVAKKYKIGGLPKKKVIMDRIKEKGFSVAETHFDREGIRSEVGIKELIQIIKK